MSFLQDIKIVIEALHDYHQDSINNKNQVIQQKSMSEIIEELDLKTYVQNGSLTEDNLYNFIHKFLPLTTKMHNPAYLGHQVAVPHYAGAIGGLIESFINNPPLIYEQAPPTTSIEYFIINWMLTKIGWEKGGGLLTNGGSLANLTALIAARNQTAPDVWKKGNPGNLALLAPDISHYSIARAAGILGIGHDNIYLLPTDENGAIIIDQIMKVYDRLMKDQKRPIALVANACCTAVGVYDDLDEIGNFCKTHNLWFHVDGAHGATALLSSKYRHHLHGLEKADSLIWDTHKMMRTPALCTAVLMPNQQHVNHIFEQQASYLIHDKENYGIDFIHRTVECTKGGLGLRFFMVLAALGEQGLANYYEKQCDLTLEVYEYLINQPDFICPVKPQSNIICFKMPALNDQEHLELRSLLIKNGDFYITSTEFNGIRYLRFTIINPVTKLDHIQELIQELRKLAQQIKPSN